MSRTISKDSFAAQKLRARLEAAVTADDLELPLLPDTAAQVLTACSSDECDARGLADLITRDPSLAGHVLRVANSAAYAPEEPIVSLQQAVSRLGMGTLCGIAVSVVAQGHVFDLPGHEDRLSVMWRHSAITAAWAREVARLRRRNVESAFLAGLLHDVGKPVVLEALCCIEQLSELRMDDDLIDDWLSEFHGAVGARLLESWGLPTWVGQSAAHHHAPEEATSHAEEARTVCLSNQLAHASDGGGEEALAALRQDPVVAALGLYVDELDELLEREDPVMEFARVFL